MQTNLIDLLLSHEPLTDLLAKDSEDNVPLINWLTRPDGTGMPAITLETVSTTPQYDQQGHGGFEPTRVQFDIWSGAYGQGREVYKVLRAFLDPEQYTPRIQDETHFDRFILDGDRDLPAADLPSGRVYHIAVDFIIWHRRAVQTS